MLPKQRTTITLREDQHNFVERFSKQHKGWTLSGFIQDQLDEIMHHDSSQLKQMIQQKKKTKDAAMKQIDKDIAELEQRYKDQLKKEEKIKQRKKAAMLQRDYDYGR